MVLNGDINEIKIYSKNEDDNIANYNEIQINDEYINIVNEFNENEYRKYSSKIVLPIKSKHRRIARLRNIYHYNLVDLL